MFAGDLTRAVDSVLDAFGADPEPLHVADLSLHAVTLPITVPVADDGVVVLSTGHVDAPRRPATLVVARVAAPAGRRGYQAAFALARSEPDPLRIPGVLGAGGPGAGPAPLASLTVAVAPDGLAVAGFGPRDTPVAVEVGEDTAGLLATALLITVGVKLRKLEMGLP